MATTMTTPYDGFAEVHEIFGGDNRFERIRGSFSDFKPRCVDVTPGTSSNGNGASAGLNGSNAAERHLPIASSVPGPRAATAFLVGESVSVVAFV